MKRIFAAVLCALLLSTATGCVSATNKQGVPAIPEAAETQSEAGSQPDSPAEEDEGEEAEEPGVYVFDNGQVSMVLSTGGRESWTTGDVLDLSVSITNNHETPIVMVWGSGSFQIPQALEIQVGDLIPMFHPSIMTFDYRLEMLEPGESLQLDCPFAPYTSQEDVLIGIQEDLSLFQEEDFTPAQPGEIQGSLHLTYTPLPEGTEMGPDVFTDVENYESATLGGDFSVTITE